ncbi:MAG: hypothetical protein D3908_13580, partial [Candidatus Electrothrix sp. AUS4]|nr:hypothetical protein [Candidatus Electrothrix sp. AUS4]
QVPEKTEPVEPVPESGGISAGTVIGIGLAAAAIGGGAYFLSQDDDDDESVNDSPTVTADPPAGNTLNCAQGGIRFQFSRDMDTSVGRVVINSPNEFKADGGWDGYYYFSWSQNNVWCRGNCADGCTLTVTLTDFQDTDQNALSGTTTFSYEMEWYR